MVGMTNPPWLSAREEAMWRGFLRMQETLSAALEAQLKEHTLSAADYGVLVVLSETPGTALRVGELGDRTRWESSRLAHQLRRMEARGLVRRFSCPADGRGTMVELTAAGLRAIEAAAPGHAATVRAAFVDHVAEGEIDVITAVAARVNAAARQSAGAPVVSVGGPV
jgi:DNA-binding MarR family transcriptional regulator